MNRLATLGLLALVAAGASAEHLSPADALSRALNSPVLKTRGSTAREADYSLSWQTSNANVYAFNHARRGYLIVAGDTDMGVALIGYSDTGRIDPANMPPALVDMLDAYSTSRLEVPVSRAGSENIEPLMSTQWDQNDPYNRDCPTIDGAPCVTGCPATAIAQVLAVKRYPDCGMGVAQARLGNSTITMNLDDHPIDWNNIVDDYTEGKFTDDQAAAVANLMHVAGMAVNTIYGTGSSGASSNDIIRGITTHLKFDKSARFLRHDFFTTSEWNRLVYDELAAGRPLVYLGFNTMAGHAFVCDGYNGDNGDMFHINWGWTGLSDGYYLLANLTPGQQGTGGSDSGYNKDQQALFGMVPDYGTVDYAVIMGLYGSFGVKNASILRTKDPEFCATSAGAYGYQGFYNVGADKVKGVFGVRIVNNATQEVTYAEAASPSELGVETRLLTFTIPAAAMPDEGEYTVTPAFRAEGGEWIDVLQEGGTRQRVTLTVTDKRFKFAYTSMVASIELTDVVTSPVGTFVNGEPVKITCKASASGDMFGGNLIPVLCQGTSIVNSMTPKFVSIDAGECVSLEWNEPFEVKLREGVYNFYIIRESDFKGLYGPVGVSVSNSAAIDAIPADINSVGAEIYDLRGSRVTAPVKGSLYIMRSGDTFIKVIY